MAPRAFICGLKAPVLSEDERAFLREASPWGVILFKRNIGAAEDIRRLCAAVREALQRETAPILIDQEGGRVQRIGPPILRPYPAGAVYGELYARDPAKGVEAARLGAQLIALDLLSLGIDIDCLPVLDLPIEGVTKAIGDRTLGTSVESVCALGGAQIDGLLAGGLLPIMKHLPGHGRAVVDSHHELPRVEASISDLEARDFEPFRRLAPRVPLAMTAHVVFSEIDPAAPATLSNPLIVNVIRARIGFNGALMTDDISMNALSGSPQSRAAAALRAGCDLVLHCNGDPDEAAAIAAVAPELEGDSLRRTEAALAFRRPPEDIDRQALEARFDALLPRAAV